MNIFLKIFRAWAFGIVWNPPPSIRRKFLVVWAVIGIGIAITLFLLTILQVSLWVLGLCITGFAIAAGLLNYAFYKGWRRQVNKPRSTNVLCLLPIVFVFLAGVMVTFSVCYADTNKDVIAGLTAGQNGDLDEAIRLFSRVIDTSNFGRELLASAFNNRGIAYRQKGLYDLAIADYNHAIKLKPDFARVYSNRGLAYAKMGLYDQSIMDFTQAIKLEPNNADVYLKRGNAYFDEQVYDEAAADYSRAIELRPHFTLAYYNRCDAYGKKELKDLAIKDCSKALELDPQLEPAKKMLLWLSGGQKGERPCMCNQ